MITARIMMLKMVNQATTNRHAITQPTTWMGTLFSAWPMAKVAVVRAGKNVLECGMGMGVVWLTYQCWERCKNTKS